MTSEFTAESLALAARFLGMEPTQYNHFIQIADGRAHWQEYQHLLDAALDLLVTDEPYSLRHMSPPPI